MKDLEAITSQLATAYMTEHGQLLCRSCVDRHGPQLGRAGIALELVPCHGAVLCSLCDRSATDL